MLRLVRPVAGALLALLAAGSAAGQSPLGAPRKPAGGSPAEPDGARPEARRPADLPALRLGALLPLTGPGSWYAEEMRRGMELAAEAIGPVPARPESGGDDRPAAPDAARSAASLRVLLDLQDVQPLDPRDAEADFRRLAASGVAAVFTASLTPTLAVYPLASARDVLVVHQGVPSDRLPSSSRTLLALRPRPAAFADALAGHARDRGARRLAVVAAGDEFGKATRAALEARARTAGTPLVRAESVSLDAPDLRSRLSELTRLAPDAVCLAFRGRELGELARRLREAGYQGLLLGLDDDPAVVLAAGPTVGGLELLTDAFVPVPGTRGAAFADIYATRFGRAPSRFAAGAYDAVTMLAEAARRSQAEGQGIPAGSRLREILEQRRTFPSLFDGQLVVRADGSVARPLALFAVDGGRASFVRYVAPADAPAADGRDRASGIRVAAR